MQFPFGGKKLWTYSRAFPSGIPVIAMIDANAEVGSEVSPFIGDKDAAQKTFSGSLLHRFCAVLFFDSACHSSRADFLPGWWWAHMEAHLW